ncbi:MAG: response regulator [Geminicoccaceae bacterium]
MWQSEERPFEGLRVLIVEDNLYAAIELGQALLDLGCEPVGPAARVDEAMRLAREETLNGALLDVELHGELIFAVAEELERRGVPVVFASGYDEEIFPASFVRHPRLRKPYGENEVRQVLEGVMRPHATACEPAREG